MKRILFFIMLIWAGQSWAQLNVWRWQNPLPVGNYLRAVQMVSATTVYACGDGATVMRSTDAGNSWSFKSNVLGFGANFYSISFSSEQFGMCAGDSGKIIKTSDGGLTWDSVDSKTKIRINGILVLDTLTAIFVTHAGAIMKTTDGGVNWTAAPTEGLPELFSIRMLRRNFITIAGANGTLIKSTDEFSTSPLKIPVMINGTQIANNFYSADFTGDEIGTIIGDNALIFHTSDGGNSWAKQTITGSNAITASLNIIDGKDPNIFAIAGDFGTVVITTNSGATWSQSYLDTRDNIKGLSFFDNMNAIAVGKNGLVLRTSDGGTTWMYLPHEPLTQFLQAVAFPKGDTSLGLAVGNGGTIMRTPDGGKTWLVIKSPSSYAFYGVAFSDETHAFIVGDYGTILTSSDAGLTWARQSSFTGSMLRAVSFANAKSGIIVGDSGIVLTTITGGEFWTYRFTDPPTTGFFNSVSFPDPQHAFIGGLAGVYKTSDGGMNWSLAPGAAHSNSMSISFTDSLHGGYVYNDRFTIGYTRSTADGGVTFDSTYPDPAGHSLYGLWFSDQRHGTVVGAFGDIYHSTDNGHSWALQPSNTSNSLYAVAFGTVKAGTAVGVRGNIMRITTNESSSVKTIGASGSPHIVIETYPNPLSGPCTIRYELPSSGLCTLEIFSTDGKRVTTLVSEYEAFGEHLVNFNANALASGAYMIKITCGNLSASEEIIVKR